MRSIWKGVISFGLVNIPVKLYSATQEEEVHFVLLHKKDLSEVRYAKICKEEEKEISQDEIVKAFVKSNGDYVVMTDEDFEKVEIENSKTLDIVKFSDADEIDPIYFEKSYFLEPDEHSVKLYVMLREALRKSNKVGIARCVLRNYERLGVLRPYENLLVWNQIRLASEIKDSGTIKLSSDPAISDKELRLALELINQMTEKFRPKEFKDTYTEKLVRYIEEKGTKKRAKAKVKPATPETSKVHDIMDLLKASLDNEKRKPTRK